jgi:hypothetical protein
MTGEGEEGRTLLWRVESMRWRWIAATAAVELRMINGDELYRLRRGDFVYVGIGGPSS